MNKKLLWTIVSLALLIVVFVTLKKTGVIGGDAGSGVIGVPTVAGLLIV